MDEHETKADVVRKIPQVFKGCVPTWPPVDDFELPKQGLAKGEDAWLPFLEPHAIEPQASIYLELEPQILFRPDRLVLSNECAPFFDVLDIKIGKNSYVPSFVPLFGSYFSPLPHDLSPSEIEKMVELSRFELDTVQPGQVIQLTVQNISDLKRNFHAWLLGKAVM